MQHRIQYKSRSFFFITEDRTWVRLDGTRVWNDDTIVELNKICSAQYNKPLDEFQPIIKKYSEIKEEREKKEEKKKKSIVKSLFKSWKIKIK